MTESLVVLPSESVEDHTMVTMILALFVITPNPAQSNAFAGELNFIFFSYFGKCPSSVHSSTFFSRLGFKTRFGEFQT
jgi:hypothetical protein